MTHINKHMATTAYGYINHKAFDLIFLVARLTGGEIIIKSRDLELVAIIKMLPPKKYSILSNQSIIIGGKYATKLAYNSSKNHARFRLVMLSKSMANIYIAIVMGGVKSFLELIK
jgi:hypothetical protein